MTAQGSGDRWRQTSLPTKCLAVGAKEAYIASNVWSADQVDKKGANPAWSIRALAISVDGHARTTRRHQWTQRTRFPTSGMLCIHIGANCRIVSFEFRDGGGEELKKDGRATDPSSIRRALGLGERGMQTMQRKDERADASQLQRSLGQHQWLSTEQKICDVRTAKILETSESRLCVPATASQKETSKEHHKYNFIKIFDARGQ